jgi:transporter family protein
MPATQNWAALALLSAAFAALTAIFAKIGLEGIDSDYATLLRTAVIVVVLASLVAALGKWRDPTTLPARSLLFLVLSGLATGATWLCYFRALKVGDAYLVAPIDKLSVVLVVVFATLFLGERPSVRDWTAIGLVTSGVLMLAMKR